MQKQKQQYIIFAKQIYAAVKGAGTDEQAILNVILQNTSEELYYVSQAFSACYGRDIYYWIKSDLSCNFGKIVTGCFVPRYTIWAYYIKDAIKGLGTDNKILIELILMADEFDLRAIKSEFFRLYKQDVFEEVSDDISKNNDWGRLIRAWFNQFRYERFQPQQDAQRLYTAAKGLGTDEQVFIEMLCTTTSEEYRAICYQYQQMYQKDLRKTIYKEFSGKSEYAYLMAHDFLIDPAYALAGIFKNAFKGAGTRDRTVVKMTVLFRDRYHKRINQKYREFYGSFLKDIKGDTSGWYEKTVCQLWNAE